MTSPAENNTSTNDWLCTQTRGDRIEFQWTIRKFHLLPQKNREGIFSPAFPDNSTEQWRIEICPQGDRKEDAGWISVYLSPASDKMLGIEVKYEITIFQLNTILGTTESTYKFEDMDGYGESRLVEQSRLSMKDDPTDTITIRCTIDVLGTSITSSEKKSSDTAVPFQARTKSLIVDFQTLYENPTLTDFTVISGSEAFPTHKVILASRCPVFAAMFEYREVNEDVKNELEIENIEPAVVKGLLEFIYTDDVTEIGELARGLLAAAEQYGLEDLKKLCEETLYKTLDENDAVELLALADLHNAAQLKEYVMQYITAHPEIVVKSQAFGSVEMPLELSKKIIRALTLSASEK